MKNIIAILKEVKKNNNRNQFKIKSKKHMKNFIYIKIKIKIKVQIIINHLNLLKIRLLTISYKIKILKTLITTIIILNIPKLCKLIDKIITNKIIIIIKNSNRHFKIMNRKYQLENIKIYKIRYQKEIRFKIATKKMNFKFHLLKII